jgi:hypothetical protein
VRNGFADHNHASSLPALNLLNSLSGNSLKFCLEITFLPDFFSNAFLTSPAILPPPAFETFLFSFQGGTNCTPVGIQL